MTESKSGALSGLKVLDLGRMVAGPYCSMLLAAMGAEVIKIEAPGSGDMARVNLPMQNGVSTYFVAFNCNKDDLTLDLKSAEGKEILRKLIMQADVLVENFRPGVMKRLGFDYDAVHQMNPRLVYASISGYGQEGELATRAAFDPVAQAMAGMVSITGTDAAHSVRCGASVADILAGQNAAVAVLGALMYREKSGCGQHIDISLVDSCISAMASVNQIYLSTGKIPAPLGNGFEASAPGNVYPCSDGWIILLAGRNSEWATLAKTLGHAEWIEDPRFLDVADRVENRKALDAVIGAVTVRYSTKELLDLLLKAKLPAGEVNNVAQVAENPFFREQRNMFVKFEHPQIGKVRTTNVALHMSETKCGLDRCAPVLGRDNRRILSSLGYTDSEIKTLQEQGVL